MSLGMSKKELAELYRMLNIILTEKKRNLSFVNSIITYKITDFLSLSEGGVNIFPSFKSNEDIINWASNNGFDINISSSNGVACLTGVRPVTNSMFYIYCRKEYSSYRKAHVAFLSKTLRQNFSSLSSFINLLVEVKIVLNDIILHKSFNESFSKRFRHVIGFLDEKIISLEEDSKIISSDEDFLLCLDFIDIDHVKCKSSVGQNDWLLMLPCYPWVNRMMGRKIERKLKHTKLLMEGNFNYIELMKTLNYGMPQDMAELTDALRMVFKMYQCKNNTYLSVESELKALFNF